MGTKFRTMLAPIGVSTGDGRRFRTGSIEMAPVPFPFEWARAREGGHDGAVVVGAIQETALLSVADAIAGDWISKEAAKGLDSELEGVFAKGELLDHVDREDMPRLAEDVAEVLALIEAGTLGPSVDLDSFEAEPVFEGTDDPVTWEAFEEYYEEHGKEPAIELLITEARVRAATLVSIPAFQETSRPLELVAPEGGESGQAAAAAVETDVLALVASVAAPPLPDPAAFDMPALTGPTPITYDRETGRVFGHIATWQTCHVGYEGVCITPPRDEQGGGYAWFNRFPVEADGGTVWAGRITAGGRHAGLSLSASAAMTQYDGKTVAAHVRAYEDAYGIVVAGLVEPGLDESVWGVLNRRKVSGDWRETPGGLSLVEVLALSPGPSAHAEPGFPVPGTFSVGGRQTALTAALGPVAGQGEALSFRARPLDISAAVRAALAEDRAVQAARSELEATVRADQEQERAALAALLSGEG
jgi:hypothetical protein